MYILSEIESALELFFEQTRHNILLPFFITIFFVLFIYLFIIKKKLGVCSEDIKIFITQDVINILI